MLSKFILIAAIIFLGVADSSQADPTYRADSLDHQLHRLVCKHYPTIPPCRDGHPSKPSNPGAAGMLILVPAGPQEATCVGDDQSVCVCTGKCEGGDTCKCLKANPFDDLPPPPADDPGNSSALNAFKAEIIGYLGTNGRACFERDGKYYCATTSDNLRKPLTSSNIPFRTGATMLCAQVDGELTGCEAVGQSAGGFYECLGEPGAGGGCRCSGIDHCLKMAEEHPNCTGGSCGDCAGENQCCCSY